MWFPPTPVITASRFKNEYFNLGFEFFKVKPLIKLESNELFTFRLFSETLT